MQVSVPRVAGDHDRADSGCVSAAVGSSFGTRLASSSLLKFSLEPPDVDDLPPASA